MDYKYLSLDQREELIQIGINLALYLHENGIRNIMFLDRSARPGYIALKKAWRDLFPNDLSPNVYFTNPEGYNRNNRSIDRIVEEFDKVYTRLSSNKDQRIVIFDVCMHSGETMRPIINTLKKAGYKNISIGLAQPKAVGFACEIPVDFCAQRYPPSGRCYPFRRDYSICKNRDSVLSSRNTNEGDIIESQKLRKEILSLFPIFKY